MKHCLALLGVAILASTAGAAVGEGENLLVNGAFDAEQVEFPEFWEPSSAKTVSYYRTGGPEGKKASIVLHDDGTGPGEVNARQHGLVLVAGETYKLSAWIKTKGFKSRHAGLVVHNSGWVDDVGFKDLPADSEWTFMEKTFPLFASSDKEYGLAMFAVDLTGELHFADLKLEAISEGARKGSSSQVSIVAAPRLVPFQPLLNRIPRAAPELALKFYGILPQSQDAYECLVTIAGNPIPLQTVPLAGGKVVVTLAGLASGDYTLEVLLRRRDRVEAVVQAAYSISIIDIPAIDRSNIKQLNNLVAEVLNQPVKNDSAPQTITFVNPRDGWVFVAFTTAAPPPGLTVQIDDRDTAITAATARLEAFRELSLGEHRITVSGSNAEARLLVHSIPEIFDYPPCADSYVKENGSYGWDFMKKHILCAVTTLNGGSLPGDALPEAKALGLKWLANFGVAPVDDPADVQARMEKHPGLTQPQYDGFTSDELFFGRTTIDNYTKALWRLRNPENRRVYTWIVGKPGIASLHTDFMSASLNASKGRGRLLFEAYCHPQADEKAAAAYLDNMIGETMRRFNAFYPNAAAGTGIIFGNFNQIPIISLEHNPAVDFKYYLDMQVNLIANSPDFAGLATTGYWGTYYGDEELARWSFMLMRHYAVEGNKDMLSARYGFKYTPGFLANCDFAAGLNGWVSSPAAEGSVRAETIAGYGKNSQGRWGGGKAGDTVCVMTRNADKPNRISQTVQGLEVGKAYCLQFVTADRNDVVGKKYNPRRYGIDAELDGAEILGDRSFVHIDTRNKGRYEHNDNVAKINLNRIILRAKSPTQVIAFSDEKATPGEELIINFIQLKPYLE
ncbi:MAG: hypothetical protein A3K19_08530 [Lentisphaerae bacterium RIFOXYB12_FULL_65_16]|nr:MAG: hypothetical protein A3K18_21900 [Lentisphaerae bacterium RIFOXYA12_64_32]OGV93434.1 MAG: hypothetical protein A3K19_08530 [Lentisphaerae bacterium RIFOXYB12_FULL_65_16]